MLVGEEADEVGVVMAEVITFESGDGLSGTNKVVCLYLLSK